MLRELPSVPSDSIGFDPQLIDVEYESVNQSRLAELLSDFENISDGEVQVGKIGIKHGWYQYIYPLKVGDSQFVLLLPNYNTATTPYSPDHVKRAFLAEWKLISGVSKRLSSLDIDLVPRPHYLKINGDVPCAVVPYQHGFDEVNFVQDVEGGAVRVGLLHKDMEDSPINIALAKHNDVERQFICNYLISKVIQARTIATLASLGMGASGLALYPGEPMVAAGDNMVRFLNNGRIDLRIIALRGMPHISVSTIENLVALQLDAVDLVKIYRDGRPDFEVGVKEVNFIPEFGSEEERYSWVRQNVVLAAGWLNARAEAYGFSHFGRLLERFSGRAEEIIDPRKIDPSKSFVYL